MKVLAQFDRTGSALYRGGFADVWKGYHRGREVAVKVIRTYTRGTLQKVVDVSSGCVTRPRVDELIESCAEVL